MGGVDRAARVGGENRCVRVVGYRAFPRPVTWRLTVVALPAQRVHCQAVEDKVELLDVLLQVFT